MSWFIIHYTGNHIIVSLIIEKTEIWTLYRVRYHRKYKESNHLVKCYTHPLAPRFFFYIVTADWYKYRVYYCMKKNPETHKINLKHIIIYMNGNLLPIWGSLLKRLKLPWLHGKPEFLYMCIFSHFHSFVSVIMHPFARWTAFDCYPLTHAHVGKLRALCIALWELAYLPYIPMDSHAEGWLLWLCSQPFFPACFPVLLCSFSGSECWSCCPGNSMIVMLWSGWNWNLVWLRTERKLLRKWAQSSSTLVDLEENGVGVRRGQASKLTFWLVSVGRVLFRDKEEASDEDYATFLLTGQNLKLLCAALKPFVFPLPTVKA